MTYFLEIRRLGFVCLFLNLFLPQVKAEIFSEVKKKLAGEK